jgi:glucan-binding YG repeat protein
MDNKWKTLALSTAFIMAGAVTCYAADGWQTDDAGQTIYMENDKKLTNRWIAGENGAWYFVNGSGVKVVSNWVNYENERYYMNEDGVLLENQWFSLTSTPNAPHIRAYTTWYYAGEGGAIYRNGWFTIDGSEYYFNGGGGASRNAVATVEDVKYYIQEDSGMENNGWFSVERVDSKGNPYTTWYYANADGSLLTNGFHELDGKTYYFDTNGANYRKRWFTLEEKRYYADVDGAIQKSGWFTISGVNGNGQEYTNWYYAAGDGDTVRGGFHELDGTVYYFDANGYNYRERWYVDADKERYYLDADGILQNQGWFKITTTNAGTGVTTDRWYYANENGSVWKDGLHDLDGKSYYFDANGVLYQDRWLSEKNGKRRYINKNGVMPRNEWFAIQGVRSTNEAYTNWYYANGSGYILKDGWHTIDGKDYYLNSSGVMKTGWFLDGDKDAYYCGEDGARAQGWQYLKIPESWYDDDDTVSNYVSDYGEDAWFYFDPSSGRKKYSRNKTFQEVTIDGKQYCVNKKGIIFQGWVKLKSASPEIRQYRYYRPAADETGVLGEKVTGQWLKTDGPHDYSGPVNEAWYYFDESGEVYSASTGGIKTRTIGGKKYMFDQHGRLLTGLIEIKGDVYYLGTEEKPEMATGKCKINDGNETGLAEYYFDSDGRGFTAVKGNSYYYKGKLQKADASSKYDVFKVGSGVYRLIDASGKIVKGKTVKDGGDTKWMVSAGGTIQKINDVVVTNSDLESYAISPDDPEADEWEVED